LTARVEKVVDPALGVAFGDGQEHHGEVFHGATLSRSPGVSSAQEAVLEGLVDLIAQQRQDVARPPS
jgi:hypothetical protein